MTEPTADGDQAPANPNVATNTYDVEVNGIRTTLNLSDADARARGLLGDDTPVTSTVESSTDPSTVKRSTAGANKARTAENK